MKRFGLVLAFSFLVPFFSPLWAQSEALAGQYLKELSGSRFVRDTKGVITDKQENLQWLEMDENCPISLNVAKLWVKKLGGDWRFPTPRELRTLYLENGGGGGSGNMYPEFKTDGLTFWSAKKKGSNMCPILKEFKTFKIEVTGCVNFAEKGLPIIPLAASFSNNKSVSVLAVLDSK